MNIIFDIDGTLADCTHRLHFIQGETKDWEAFFAAAKYDRAINEMINFCITLGTVHDIYLVTVRPDRTR